MRNKLLVFTALAFLLSAFEVSAQYTGGNGRGDIAANKAATKLGNNFFADGNWSGTGNWSAGALPATSETVHISANATVDADASVQSITIYEGSSLTIPSGKTLTINGTFTNNAGNGGLVIKSGGSLIHNSDNIAATVKLQVTGSATLTANKYHFVSIPTQYSNPTAELFLDSYLYKLDPTQQINPPVNPAYGKWVSLGNSISTQLFTNQGYMIYYPGDSKEYTYEGDLNNGTYIYELTGHSGSEVHTFNLIPNPFPSSIIWNTGDALKWSKSTGIGGTCYIWNAASGNYSNIASGASSYIPVGQAFMVLVSNDDAPALSVLNAARTHSTQAFYKSANTYENQLVVIAASNNYSDETIVKFSTEATEDFDLQTDGIKLFGLEDAPQLYTQTAERKFSINNLPVFQDQCTVDMYFESHFTGEIALNFEGLSGFDPTMNIYLKDELTNQTINLRNQPVYTFSHTPENAANRFKLVFGGTIGIEETNAEQNKMWLSGNRLFIAAPELIGQQTLVEVINSAGQKLLSKTIVLSELSTMELMIKGFVLVKLTSEQKVLTTKGILMK